MTKKKTKGKKKQQNNNNNNKTREREKGEEKTGLPDFELGTFDADPPGHIVGH